MRPFRDLVLEAVEDDIVDGDDRGLGLYVLHPNTYTGALGPEALRIIADELERRSEGWRERVREDLKARAREGDHGD